MSNQNSNSRSGGLLDELKIHEIRKEIKREYRDLKDFYLDDSKKEKLKNMGRAERFIYQTGYLFTSIFQKLTSFRKFLVIFGLILMFLGNNTFMDNQSTSNNTTLLGGLIIFFVLVLELKDKLLAVEELIAGKKIQTALMPNKTPQVDGWDVFLFTTSANEVSGDLVDYLKIDDNKIAITLADVAGKGLSAALLTAKLQATVRAYAETSSSPAEITRKTNKIFHRDSLPNLFASMVFLEISTQTNKINFANAGHLPPVVISKGELKELGKGGAALGILPDFNFRNFNEPLNKDDVFLVYSDGITEAIDEMGQFFGKDKFFSLLNRSVNLSSSQLGQNIINYIIRYRGQAKISDDISLVILKKK